MDTDLELVFMAWEQWDTVINPEDGVDLEKKFYDAVDSFLASKGLGKMSRADFLRHARKGYARWRLRKH